MTGVYEADTGVWKPPGGLSEDFPLRDGRSMLFNYTSDQNCFTKKIVITCYHFMYTIKFIFLMFSLSLNDFISAETLITFCLTKL